MRTSSASIPTAAGTAPRARGVPAPVALLVASLALWSPFTVVALRMPSLRTSLIEDIAVLPGIPIAVAWLGADDSNRIATGGVTLVLVVGLWMLARRRPVLAAVLGLALGSLLAGALQAFASL